MTTFTPISTLPGTPGCLYFTAYHPGSTSITSVIPPSNVYLNQEEQARLDIRARKVWFCMRELRTAFYDATMSLVQHMRDRLELVASTSSLKIMFFAHSDSEEDVENLRALRTWFVQRRREWRKECMECDCRLETVGAGVVEEIFEPVEQFFRDEYHWELIESRDEQMLVAMDAEDEVELLQRKSRLSMPDRYCMSDEQDGCSGCLQSKVGAVDAVYAFRPPSSRVLRRRDLFSCDLLKTERPHLQGDYILPARERPASGQPRPPAPMEAETLNRDKQESATMQCRQDVEACQHEHGPRISGGDQDQDEERKISWPDSVVTRGVGVRRIAKVQRGSAR